MEESEEELNSLLMKVKEESEKVGLKFNIHISTCILHRYTWDKIKLKKKKQTNKQKNSTFRKLRSWHQN